MKKVLHFDSPPEWYACDAAVLSCFDCRVDLAIRKFLDRTGIVKPDSIKVAGGVKNLTSPDAESDREFVLEQIRKSISLHGTRRVILFSHSDCGAYGRLGKRFQGDTKAEATHHENELALAAENLLRTIPGLQVQGYFVDFEGIYEAELKGSQSEERRPVA